MFHVLSVPLGLHPGPDRPCGASVSPPVQGGRPQSPPSQGLTGGSPDSSSGPTTPKLQAQPVWTPCASVSPLENGLTGCWESESVRECLQRGDLGGVIIMTGPGMQSVLNPHWALFPAAPAYPVQPWRPRPAPRWKSSVTCRR